MSTNAASWFYQQPEPNPYLITERLNATFWQARIVGLYWRADNAAAPFHAFGYAGEHALEMDWMPGQWVSLKVPAAAETNGLPNGTQIPDLVESISKRILAIPASISFGDGLGHKVYEWHMDGGKHRWSEVQGKPGFVKPTRLSSK